MCRAAILVNPSIRWSEAPSRASRRHSLRGSAVDRARPRRAHSGALVPPRTVAPFRGTSCYARCARGLAWGLGIRPRTPSSEHALASHEWRARPLGREGGGRRAAGARRWWSAAVLFSAGHHSASPRATLTRHACVVPRLSPPPVALSSDLSGIFPGSGAASLWRAFRAAPCAGRGGAGACLARRRCAGGGAFLAPRRRLPLPRV